MRESRKEKERKARERRRLILIGACATVAALLLVGGVVVMASTSGEQKASACVVADVSISTAEARTRYTEEFGRFATSIGRDGTGDICVIFAAADPLAESLAEPLFVGPAESKKGGVEELSDIEAKVAIARDELDSRLADPDIREKGSALLEAAVDASLFLEPGDRLLYLSDGLQWTPGLHLPEEDLSPTAITALLAKLEAEGLVPDLDGVKIEFPYLLFHPGGLDEQDVRQIVEFWEGWAERTGATITVREPVEQ